MRSFQILLYCPPIGLDHHGGLFPSGSPTEFIYASSSPLHACMLLGLSILSCLTSHFVTGILVVIQLLASWTDLWAMSRNTTDSVWKDDTVIPRFIVFVGGGPEGERWIRENDRCGAI
jgi:hypothetical protein